MTVDWMREKLMNVPKYDRAPRWLMKVRHMSDNQVIAVYYKMLSTGEFEQKVKKVNNSETYHQMDIFEFIK